MLHVAGVREVSVSNRVKRAAALLQESGQIARLLVVRDFMPIDIDVGRRDGIGRDRQAVRPVAADVRYDIGPDERGIQAGQRVISGAFGRGDARGVLEYDLDSGLPGIVDLTSSTLTRCHGTNAGT
jgi:hypothetical protein